MGFLDDIREDDNTRHAEAQASSAAQPSTPASLSMLGTPATSRQLHSAARAALNGSPVIGLAIATPYGFRSSTLISRKRPREEDPWTPMTKRAHIDFAESLSSELELTDEGRSDVVKASTMSTHQLLVTMFAHHKQTSIVSLADRGKAFLKSREYKDHVVSALFGYLMDGDVSGYKQGLLRRVVHHIRLHPKRYRIPPDIEDFIATSDFVTAISRSVSSIRSEMKRKLKDTWKEKKGIYDVVRRLIGQSSNVQATEAMWGRWAWVQLSWSDFQDLVKSGEKKQDKFWDWTDELLVELRREFRHLSPHERAQRISGRFEAALRKHIGKHPPRRKPAIAPAPAWQRQLREAVKEMEGYTEEEIAYIQDGDEIDDGESSED